MKKCVVIYNPISGREKAKECIEDFYTVLKKHGYDLQLIYTKDKGDATKIIQELEHPDLVICAGGDGTLNEVIKGNMNREERLIIGLLPLGTTNDVAYMLGYSRNYVKNLELLLSGKEYKYDIGIINNEYPFVYVAALGDLTSVSYLTPNKLKRKFGRLAYILYGIKQIFKKTSMYNIRYRINGKNYQGKYSYVFVTNTNVIGGKKNIYRDIKLNDHLLEVAFVKTKTKLELLKVFYYILISKIKECSLIEIHRTNYTEINVEDCDNVSWCIDGEQLELKSTSIKFSVDIDSTLLVPIKKTDNLFK